MAFVEEKSAMAMENSNHLQMYLSISHLKNGDFPTSR